MTYVQPEQVVKNMVQAGAAKSKLPVRDLVIRGALAGALLGFGTTLAFTAETQTQMGIVGALLFPACFVIIILLGLELVTGNFALIPLAVLEKKATWQEMLTNWFWVIVGHVIGGSFYAMLYVIAATHLGHVTDHAVAQKIIQVAEAKTLGYSALGTAGLLIVFVKGILCNWMVALGAVMAMTSQATLGKIVAMWLPILLFFAQGFEHAVVNMFVIPAGMMLGADITLSHWWIWNQTPVLLGNLVGGLLFTGLALYVTYRSREVNKGKEQVKNDKGKRERMVS
ncbi:formate/nitrite transporter family protein [Peribacillus asahii]|uniref:Putative nitrite transporter n=1 Tax=Peribacillus asahii TaxID=228899 RepID=A0A3Q9RK77_9BACI|nr:formate/nitrite transporter family protein [Peribacillus asahii]AZV41174.1 putative nitrite transporter [Peribacillus asahii]USK85549.1 formate/nitrite transporter family protein [Peribacillus asahii]